MERSLSPARKSDTQQEVARGKEAPSPGPVRRFLIGFLNFLLRIVQALLRSLGAVEDQGGQDQIRVHPEGELARMKRQISFLNGVFESTTDAVIVADLRGTITMFNKGAEEIFEIEAELARGDNLFRLCADRVRLGCQDINRLLCQDRAVRNLRTQFLGMRGKVTPALLTLNFVRDGRGQEVAIVAVIKDNTEVERLTYTDALTGLYNRRFFDQKVREEYNLLSRGQMRELTLLFMDIDFFGDFNKLYGHQVGDLVLQKVGEVLLNTVRVSDAATRYGGEEFVVIAPSTDEAGGQLLAERIRQRISEIRIPVPGMKEVRITASIGVKTHRPKDESTVVVFIQQANTAMLLAKRMGRNRTCLG